MVTDEMLDDILEKQMSEVQTLLIRTAQSEALNTD
jgi:hypothetical protein